MYINPLGFRGKYQVRASCGSILRLLWSNCELLSLRKTTRLCQWKIHYASLLLLTLVGRYYTLSVILGTVALSYGSVPMYKMVGHYSYHACVSYVLMQVARSVNRPVGAGNQSKLQSIRMLRILLRGSHL